MFNLNTLPIAPKVFDFYELNEYLILSRNIAATNMYYHPYNQILKYNNNEDRNRLKQAKVYLYRYIKSLKSFKEWTFDFDGSKNEEFISDLLKLLFHRTKLGVRYKKLYELRNYFTLIQGSVFWINIVKAVLANLISNIINYHQA